MRIAALVKPDDGCCYYRIVLPFDHIQWEDTDSVKLFYPRSHPLEGKNRALCGGIDELEAFNPDIVFLNRSLFDKSISWLKTLKDRGIKIVVDIDDFWELSCLHPFYTYWYKHSINKAIQETIRMADLVLTTNERLRNIVLRLNNKCEVVPNAVPYGDKDFTPDTLVPKSNKMTFLYAGGSSHTQDVSLLKNKFERLGSLQKVRDSAKFVLAGFNPLPTTHCEWDKMASIFKRTNSYEILDTLPIQKHMSFYDKADVVLVPLVKNEFNQYKSVLKIIEASTRKLPCIVSDVAPYSDLKNIPGLFWENWVENIKYSINNPTFVKDQGELLYQEMKKRYDIRDWSKIRYELFKSLV